MGVGDERRRRRDPGLRCASSGLLEGMPAVVVAQALPRQAPAGCVVHFHNNLQAIVFIEAHEVGLRPATENTENSERKREKSRVGDVDTVRAQDRPRSLL